MKLYGIAYSMGFPCLCLGKKAWYFKLYWSPVKKRLIWQSWKSNTKDVWWQRINSHPFRFFGFMVLPNEDVYDI